MTERERIKTIAVTMVEKSGLINLSRLELCKRADIPNGSFPHVMGCTFSDFIRELNKETTDTKNHIVTKNRVDPELRKDQILNAAIDYAKKVGYHKITREGIATNAGVSINLINRYFGTMPKFKRSIMRAAINQEVLEIVAQGLAAGDSHAKKAPPELKKQAASLIANY